MAVFKSFILLLMAGAALSAKELAEVCRNGFGQKIQYDRELDVEPNYFIKGARDKNLIAFADGDDNHIYDIDEGRLFKTPGVVDPVPLPDGNTLMTPDIIVYNPKTRQYLSRPIGNKYAADASSSYIMAMNKSVQRGELVREQLEARGEPYFVSVLAFYSLKDIRKGGAIAPIAVDMSMSDANYPSVGRIAVGGENRLRVLSNGGGGPAIRDYRLTNGSDGPSIEPIGEQAAKICEGHNFPRSKISLLSQPSLSQDGSEFGTYDALSGDMKIMSARPDGRCEEHERLPFAAGKMDFSPDGRKIVFHVDHTEEGPIQFTRPSDKQTLHTYLYDRDTKKFTPLNTDPNLDTFYPTFLSDGRIAFFARDKRRPDAPLRLEIIDPPRENENDTLKLPDGCRDKKSTAFASLLAIGRLYEKICEDSPSMSKTTDGALMTALSLDPATCRKTVEKYWRGYQKEILKTPFQDSNGFNDRKYTRLNVNDLLAVCP
jgi:hypothetical protein